MILVLPTVDFASVSLSNSAIGAITVRQLLFNLFFLIDPLKAFLLMTIFLGFFFLVSKVLLF